MEEADFQAIRSSVFPVKKLKRLSTLVTKGETPLWRGDSFLNEGVPFLRGKNIKGKIDFDDIVYISEDVHERMKRSVLNEDFFLLTIAGTLGDVAVFKKEYPECNINQDIAKIKLTDEISYEYAVVYFQTKFANSQIRILSNGATRGHLNFSQVRSFDVIVPPSDLQNHAVEIMQSAHAQKRQKDQEADAVLDSIDDYVSAELGIEMPVVEEQKCFVVYANETSGRRGDPHFHQPKYHNFYSMLEASKYQIVMLANLIKLIYRYPSCYGFSCYDSASDTRVPFLQGEDIGVNEISHEKLIFIEKEISAQYPKTILKEGDLIFSVRGTIGKIVVVTHAFENSNISPNLIRLSLNEGVNPQYVEIVLKSKIGQYQIDRLTSGGVQPTITKQYILSIEIPLPSLDRQNEIVQEVMRQQSEAAKLRQEADAIVEAAKRETERILLERVSS